MVKSVFVSPDASFGLGSNRLQPCLDFNGFSALGHPTDAHKTSHFTWCMCCEGQVSHSVFRLRAFPIE